jgi:putative spermidine/putrescine transport system substrate-binding protein
MVMDGMMNRRSLLLGLTSLGAGSLLTGCFGASESSLTVRILSGSVPPQLLGEFQKAMRLSLGTVHLHFAPETQLQTLFELLQDWKRKGITPAKPSLSLPGWVPFVGDRGSAVPDLVSLGHYWLPQAIQQGLIQPLDPVRWSHWPALAKAPQWQSLVTRNDKGELDAKGKVWAAPYRWGHTVIAYRRDLFQQQGWAPPQDWADLWRPELQRQISLLDHPREVIGLTLKKLGHSYNVTHLTGVKGLEAALKQLHQQAKLYSSDAYLQPLLRGDTAVVVGWSTDVLPLVRRNAQIAAVIPQSGTALWAELWVRPSTATTRDVPVVNDWINFCWGVQIAERLTLLSGATSPAIVGVPPEQLSPELRGDRLLLPDAQLLAKSEFLQPLPEATVTQYRNFWTHLRTS